MRSSRALLSVAATLLLVPPLTAAIACGDRGLPERKPLSPEGRAFVDDLRGFSTLQTKLIISPWTGGPPSSMNALLSIRSDGAMTLDGPQRSRRHFNGAQFTGDAFGVTGGPREVWPGWAPTTNSVFAAIRDGSADWTGNDPTDYQLETGPSWRNYDWAELHLSDLPLSGVRVFVMLDGTAPARLYVYDQSGELRGATFMSWVVNSELAADTFSPEAPAHEAALWRDGTLDSTPK